MHLQRMLLAKYGPDVPLHRREVKSGRRDEVRAFMSAYFLASGGRTKNDKRALFRTMHSSVWPCHRRFSMPTRTARTVTNPIPSVNRLDGSGTFAGPLTLRL